MINSGQSVFLKNNNSNKEIEKTVIKVPGDTSLINKVSSEILKKLSSYGLSDDTIFDIRLCVDEALVNAIVHGNKKDKSLFVTVTYHTDGERLIIEVEDNGSGFDSTKISDPTDDDNLLKGYGRGVYLIKKLMDKVEYNRKGNKIIMTKMIRRG